MYIEKKGDLKTSDKFFVTFDKLRKIHFDEFPTILPKNYDSEINNKLKTYRHRRTDDEIPEITEKTAESSIEDIDIGQTRSGKFYNISTNMISHKYVIDVLNCTVTLLEKHKPKNIVTIRSCLKKEYMTFVKSVCQTFLTYYDIAQLKQMAAYSIERIIKFTKIKKKYFRQRK